MINFAWLCFSILTKEFSIGLIMMIPLGLGLIIFFIAKQVKKFDTLRALKYANLAAGLILVGIFYLMLKIKD